jgi:predicted O-methyltransferase YrrM
MDYKIQQKKPEWMCLLNLLNLKNIDNILEIGANTGGSTVTLSHFAKKLVTIDVINPPLFDTNSINKCEYKYLAGNSQSEDMFEQVKKEFNQVDFLMIDGDHSHQGSYNDYLMYKNLVRPGGMIAFHDIIDSPNHHMLRCFVADTWKLVKNDHKNFKEFIYTNDLTPQTLSEAYHEPYSWAGVGVVYVD